ncbi:MAG: GH25 family lysozyme [Streptosporangiaceae bacterium]
MSERQGPIDWAALAGSVGFVIIRADDGVQRADLTYRANAEAAWAAGVPAAFYHEIDPLGAPAGLQALAFAHLTAARVRVPLALGLEDPDGRMGAAFAAAFAATLIALGRPPPLVYLDRAMLAAEDWSACVGLGCGLWLAEPTGATGAPQGTAPWPFAALRQYSWEGVLPGVEGPVDLDAFYGDADQFAAYGG